MYFVDTGDGVEYYITSEEAKAAAQDALNRHREYANISGEWFEDVERICWGCVMESATECATHGGVWHGTDYELYPIKD